MTQAILLKEWLKLRWALAATLTANLAVAAWILAGIRQQLRQEHAEMVWYQVMHIQTVPYLRLCFLPLATGLILAATQFVPEMLGRRLRLSLHLPLGRTRLLLTCLLLGMLFLLAAVLPGMLLVVLALRAYFPVEVAWSALQTMAPWLLAGLLAYLGGVAVLLEGRRRRRTLLALIFAILLSLYFGGSGYGWLVPLVPLLAALPPMALLTALECGRGFQEGAAAC